MTILYLILSVVAGIILVEATGLDKSKYQKLFLTFSGAFLFAITILHILPESLHSHQSNIGLFILFGFLLQFLLDYISGGIEHGHYHHAPKKETLPVGLLLGLFVHAIIEGIPTSVHHGHNHILLSAILLHKVPISMILFIFLKQATQSKFKQFISIGLFAICAPIGFLLGDNLSLIANNSDYLMAFTAGIFIHVSTSIIFESGEEHKLNIKKFLSIMIGFLVAFLTIWLQ